MSAQFRLLAFSAFVLLLTAPLAEAARLHRSVGLSGVRFAHSVDGGDFNGDGLPDVVVGAPLDNGVGSEFGKAYVWFGRPGGGIAVDPDLVLSGGSGATPHFGWSVAAIGDLNGDGFDDVAVGAPLDDQIGADAGAVFVFYGGMNMDESLDLSLHGESGDDRFGWWVSRGGDLDDDGCDDLLVGAPYADAIGQDAGSVYLFKGAIGAVSTSFARRFDGAVAFDHFGWCVAEVPDFRGNGRPSFVVGAPGAFGDAGRAYLYYGGSVNTLPDQTVDVTFGGSVAGEELGWAVSGIGNFDNSALRSDVAIGAPGANGDRGYVKVFYGAASPSPTPVANLTIIGIQGGDRFGDAVSGAGDFSGSLRDDMIVGASMRSTPAAESGHAFLFEGGASYGAAGDGTALAPSNMPDTAFAGDFFGFAVANFGGDLDGDGRSDLIVGAPAGNNASNVTAGIVALIGSGGGIVPVQEIPFAVFARGDLVELRFGGAAALAEEAELWTTGLSVRLLASSAWGSLTRSAGELVAELPLSTLASLGEVELRFWQDGVQARSLHKLPPLTPLQLSLSAAPNPFNPSTQLKMILPQRERFELNVVDLRGRIVRHLASGIGGPGESTFDFDGRDDAAAPLASGSYRVLLRSASGRVESSILLLK